MNETFFKALSELAGVIANPYVSNPIEHAAHNAALFNGILGIGAEIVSNPSLREEIDDFFGHSHTGLDVAQDALDACDHGKMSHDAALKIVAIALDDDMKRKQKRKERRIN